MPVGHTHNDVDWYFSIMAGKLKKKEIPSFEHLICEVKKLRVDDVSPVVIEMKSTSNFIKLVSPHLNKLSGHSSFFQFKFKKEKPQGDDEFVTKMYVKENPLDEKWQFLNGIRLLKSRPEFDLLEVSPFREESSYGEIYRSVKNKYFPTLENKFPENEIIKVEQSWEKRIEFLQACNPKNFKSFNIKKLKPQTPSEEEETRRENIKRFPSRREAALTATFFPTEMGSFSAEDLKADVSVVFYTNVKKSRPWIGLFQGLSSDTDGNSTIEVQWLYQHKKQYFLSLNQDGSAYTSKLELESIMFSDVLSNISATGERTGPYVMDVDTVREIKNAYEDRDKMLNDS